MSPDLRGCDIHGLADYRVYKYTSGRIERRCLACARERSPYTHRNFGPRCRRGHLKTPWSWRSYSGVFRCMPCHYMKRREKKIA